MDQRERKKFYNSKQWQQKRSQILKRDKYLCQECRKYLKRSLAEHVHHIISVEDNPTLRLTSSNLISLCTACHSKIENRFRK